MKVKVHYKNDSGSGTSSTVLEHVVNQRDYLVEVGRRVNVVEIRGGNDSHPLQLVEMKVYGGE